MANDDKRVFDFLLDDYLTLEESAGVVARQLKKISKPESRGKVIAELRRIENRRLEILDRMDNPPKST